VIVIGVDPGLTGAIAAIFPSGEIEFHDMPVLVSAKRSGKGKDTQIDYAGLAHILRRYPARGEVMAIVEQVGVMPGEGPTGAFKFGLCNGALFATLATLQIPYTKAIPQTWKRPFGLLKTEKDEARQKALQLFPQCIDHLNLKKHSGRADALLLAEYLRRQSQGGTIAA
jgi:hypothetical protein